MKTHITCLLLTSVLALGGGTSIWADTTSSQTDVTITVKASPSVVPAPNQIIPCLYTHLTLPTIYSV